VALLSHIGVSSGAPLIGHFLEHYTRLGVDRFFLLLHAEEGDERRPAILDLMGRYGVRPAMDVTVFNTRLKLERFNAILDEHVAPDDWVLYADVDEFHVYPRDLHVFLRGCDEHGYMFVRGRLIDRIAEAGELRAVRPSPSLWDQFPYAAQVTTEVRRGWDGKVCAAKATLRLEEGGLHTLDYGCDRLTNYERTLADPRGYRDPIDVHHFRWDASLLQRAIDKLNAVGGDTDAIDDPPVMEEYERIRHYVETHGRIDLPDVRYIGTPELRYER
jgi:hypothetical protein